MKNANFVKKSSVSKDIQIFAILFTSFSTLSRFKRSDEILKNCDALKWLA